MQPKKKLPLLLALAFALLPLSAHADILYKCESGDTDRWSAQIRFSESGRNGYLELDDWNGYPPVGIVYASLHETQPLFAAKTFLSEQDKHSGHMAELRLPKNFLGRQDFPVTLQVIRKDGAKEPVRNLHCVSF